MTLDPHLTDSQAQGLVDGAIADAEAAALGRHVAGCAECSATVEAYRLLSGALEDLDVPALPSDFTDGVLARIERHDRAVTRERRWAAAIFAGFLAASAAAFALAGANAWAPAVSTLADVLAGATRAARIGGAFVPAVVGALRFQIVLAAGLLALPLLLALNRLMPRPEREIA